MFGNVFVDDRTRQSSTTWFGVLSAKKRPLVPPPSDPTLPLRSPGGGTYSTGGATLTSDYGWQRTIPGPATGSCMIPASMTMADPFDCELALPGAAIDGDQITSEQLQQQQQQQRDDRDECLTDQRWPVDGARRPANDITAGPDAEVEVNYGLRLASYRAAAAAGATIGSTTQSPCRATTAGTAATGCPDIESHHPPRSPMMSFGTRWTGIRTHFYEVPPPWQT
jgi:hypothetical protein